MLTKGSRHIRELLGLLFLFLGLLIGISLWSHNINDPTLNQSISSSYEIKNYAGTFGAYLSGFLSDFFGLAAYIWVLFFFGMGLGFIIRWVVIPWYTILGYTILALCFICFAEAVTLGIGDIQGGGFFGAWLYASLHQYFNPIGGTFIWLFCLMVGIELCFHVSWVTIFSQFIHFLLRKKYPQEEKQETETPIQQNEEQEKPKKRFQINFKLPLFKKYEKNTQENVIDENNKTLDIISDLSLQPKEIPTHSETNSLTLIEDKTTTKETLTIIDETAKNTDETPNQEIEKTEEKSKKSFLSTVFLQKNNTKQPTHTPQEEQKKEEYNKEEQKEITLPPLDLLSPIPEQKDAPTKANLEEKGRKLIQCLSDFNAQGKLAGILPGPVVTMYEVRPERGVKVSRFESLAKEIAMEIKAVAVRIQAPIPGTDTVGVEVPNDKRQLVSFKEIIQSKNFTDSPSKLTLGLGKDIFGSPVSVKMDDMPHLLVAGATGAGKSVCLNTIILSILYKAQPDQVKMLLIDPKRVELSMYNGLPHLVHPVVTDVELAKNALLWAVTEMDQRYRLFENLGMRNITEYNAFVQKNKDKEPSENLIERLQAIELENLEELPFIVIIVDELADLMMQKGKEVEGQIARLGQLARAAGMHIILATQRPSVDVVTGLIKNNFPARIAFQVSSPIDSRTIIDTSGAEALLGKGDMLFKPRAGGLQRIHGAFVTDEEVRSVTNYWRKQQEPNYKIDFTQFGTSATEATFSESDDSEYDSMFDTILNWVLERDEVSISMLQRQFRLGFSRAGRIIDQLERDGYVEARSGSKARKVIHS